MASILFASLLGRNLPQRHRYFRRGGWRQRVAEAPNEVPDNDQGLIGKLGPGMLLDFCDGWLSAYRLCSHMKNASDDGSKCRLVQALGKIADVSTPHSHCNAGVVKLLSSLPVLNIISAIDDSSTTHFIKPTSLIRVMQDNYPREFRLRFGADCDKIRSFWDDFSDRPQEPTGQTNIHSSEGRQPRICCILFPLSFIKMEAMQHNTHSRLY